MKLAILGLIVAGSLRAAPLVHVVHPGGFTVDHPAAWRIEANSNRILILNSSGDLVAIEAVPNPRSLPPAQLLKLLSQTGQIGPLNKPKLWLARQNDTASATAQLETANLKPHALLSVHGTVATLMLVAAPSSTFAQRLPELMQILQSFRFTNVASQAKPKAVLQYQRLIDSREQAFSTEVPIGWRTEIGTYRPMVGDFRFETQTQSPDGSIFSFAGDRNIGRFIVPTPQMAQFNVREGGFYNPSGSVSYSVLRYLPGVQFAQYYLNRRFPGARITKSQDLSRINAQASALRYRNGNPNQGRLDTGELDFEFQGKQGYLFVTTEIAGGAMGMNFWNVVSLTGYLCASENTVAAAEVTQQLINAGRPNPQWVMREYRMQAIEAEQGMATLKATNEIWTQTLAQRSESNSRNSLLVGDGLSGQYRMLDPTTGQQVNVQATSNYFYRLNQTNQVLGVNQELGANTPIDVTRLLRIDVDIRQ